MTRTSPTSRRTSGMSRYLPNAKRSLHQRRVAPTSAGQRDRQIPRRRCHCRAAAPQPGDSVWPLLRSCASKPAQEFPHNSHRSCAASPLLPRRLSPPGTRRTRWAVVCHAAKPLAEQPHRVVHLRSSRMGLTDALRPHLRSITEVQEAVHEIVRVLFSCRPEKPGSSERCTRGCSRHERRLVTVHLRRDGQLRPRGQVVPRH